MAVCLSLAQHIAVLFLPMCVGPWAGRGASVPRFLLSHLSPSAPQKHTDCPCRRPGCGSAAGAAGGLPGSGFPPPPHAEPAPPDSAGDFQVNRAPGRRARSLGKGTGREEVVPGREPPLSVRAFPSRSSLTGAGWRRKPRAGRRAGVPAPHQTHGLGQEGFASSSPGTPSNTRRHYWLSH